MQLDRGGELSLSLPTAPHDAPQISYRVAVLELFHGEAELFAVERLPVLLAVAFAKICGKFRVNFARCHIIYLGHVVNSQRILLFILQFYGETEKGDSVANGEHDSLLVRRIYHRFQVIIYSENRRLTIHRVQ